MGLIVSQIEAEHPELFALEFGKIADYDLVYSPASTNILLKICLGSLFRSMI